MYSIGMQPGFVENCTDDLTPSEDLSTMSGLFYCGDNLEILNELNLVPAESVDLIYLDPPFNSKRTYNITYKDSRAQAEAFKDHWSWEEAAPQYAKLCDAPETPPKLKTLLRGLRDLLIDDAGGLLAYVTMMAPRLFALHRVLKPTGSLYLHCDGTASHYLKLLLDALFGPKSFANHISWKRTTAHNDAKRFGRITDHILFYAKTAKKTFNRAPGGEYSPEQLSRYKSATAEGRKYKCENLTAPHFSKTRTLEWRGTHPGANRQWRFGQEELDRLWSEGRIATKADGTPRKDGLIEYLDEAPGPVLQDIWTDIVMPPTLDERVGFDTQKPVELLARIIASSSNPGDLVLDPFCGCGTTIEACEVLGRRWIGIDIAAKAIEVTEERFKKRGWEPPEVKWYPPDRDAAEALMKRKEGGKKFEIWMLRKIRAAKSRKHDRGIDGEAFFDDQGKVTHVIVSVKGGKLNPAMVRELRGTVERERVAIGVLATLHEPSKEMMREATHMGYLTVDGRQIPRLQILTVDQVFRGEGIVAPGRNVTKMPEPMVPTGEPKHQEQLSLRLEPPKPLVKSKNERMRATKRAAEEVAATKPRKRGGVA